MPVATWRHGKPGRHAGATVYLPRSEIQGQDAERPFRFRVLGNCEMHIKGS